MSSAKRVQKEDIIKASFSILLEKGIDKVNARDIAKKLNISVQPIFYRFDNMDDLKQNLLQYSLNYYQEFLLDTKGSVPKYKEIGINYIHFAKQNSNKFKFIFMGDYHIKIEEFAYFDQSYEEVEKILQVQNKISSDKVKKMHLKMWMFTHGIACLIATNTCDFTDDEISMLLTEEFQALMNDLCHKDS